MQRLASTAACMYRFVRIDIRNSARWAPNGPVPFLAALAGCALAFSVRLALQDLFGSQLPTLFFIINCLLVSFVFGFWPALLALAVGFPIAWFAFVPPHFALSVATWAEVVGALSTVGLTLVGVLLIEWLRRAHYSAELHARVSDARYRMLVDSDQDRRSALAAIGDAAA